MILIAPHCWQCQSFASGGMLTAQTSDIQTQTMTNSLIE